MAVDPTTLVDQTDIGPQTASQMLNLKPQEIFELVEDEVSTKSEKEINAIKKCIGNICREQALAHRHVAEAADNMVIIDGYGQSTDPYESDQCDNETNSGNQNS